MPKLNKQFIDSEIQSPASGQRFYRDDELPGFAIRVTCNSKSYILEKRVGGSNRRITIGKCSEISLDAARKQAQVMLGEIAKGNDPKTGKRINTLNDVTLREVVQKYLEVKPLRKTTQKNYTSERWSDRVAQKSRLQHIYKRHCFPHHLLVPVAVFETAPCAGPFVRLQICLHELANGCSIKFVGVQIQSLTVSLGWNRTCARELLL